MNLKQKLYQKIRKYVNPISIAGGLGASILLMGGLTIGYDEVYKPIIERREQQRLLESEEQRLALEDTLKSEALKDTTLIRDIITLRAIIEEGFSSGEGREKRLQIVIDAAVTPIKFKHYIFGEGLSIIYSSLNSAKDDTLYYDDCRPFYGPIEIPIYIGGIPYDETKFVMKNGFKRNTKTDAALYRLEDIAGRLQHIQRGLGGPVNVKKIILGRIYSNCSIYPYNTREFKRGIKIARDFANAYEISNGERRTMEIVLIQDLYDNASGIGGFFKLLGSNIIDPVMYVNAARFLAKDISYDTRDLERLKIGSVDSTN